MIRALPFLFPFGMFYEQKTAKDEDEQRSVRMFAERRTQQSGVCETERVCWRDILSKISTKGNVISSFLRALRQRFGHGNTSADVILTSAVFCPCE